MLAAGSVNKLLPIPGVAEHAHGFRGIAEALYLRDHITRQIELADATDDPEERAARCTFVVVGAGYTGTEVAAQGVLLTDAAGPRPPARCAGSRPRWLLLDIADAGAARAGPAAVAAPPTGCCGSAASRCAPAPRWREATADGVRLTDGAYVPTRTLIWCVGVRPDPLVERPGAAHRRRAGWCVDEYLTVPGHPEVFACGDAAAVPDLTRPGQITPMTAQHAIRQGAAGRAQRRRRRYGTGAGGRTGTTTSASSSTSAGSTPRPTRCGCRCPGCAAKAVTRGYHLLAMPGNRARVVTDWLLDALLPTQAVQLGLVRGGQVPLGTKPELAVVSPQHGEQGVVDPAVAGHDVGDRR